MFFLLRFSLIFISLASFFFFLSIFFFQFWLFIFHISNSYKRLLRYLLSILTSAYADCRMFVVAFTVSRVVRVLYALSLLVSICVYCVNMNEISKLWCTQAFTHFLNITSHVRVCVCLCIYLSIKNNKILTNIYIYIGIFESVFLLHQQHWIADVHVNTYRQSKREKESIEDKDLNTLCGREETNATRQTDKL